MAKHFNWKIQKIDLYPYGGCVKFDEPVNSSLKEELFILLNGPLFQMIYFLIIICLAQKGIISNRNFIIIKQYHYTLLFFNLLPIYPLDGGKLFNIILCYLAPYKLSNYITILISILLLITLIFFYHNLNFDFMVILLFVEVIIFLKRQDYLYNRLLLERYLNNYCFNKIKVINNKNNIYKEKKHVIKDNNYYYTEKEYLKKRYERK